MFASAASVQCRSSAIHDFVLIRIFHLRYRQRFHVRNEHAATTHHIHAHVVEDVAHGLPVATPLHVLGMEVRDNGVARVAPYGEHVFEDGQMRPTRF